jgi:endonuclease G, mitochondrial
MRNAATNRKFLNLPVNQSLMKRRHLTIILILLISILLIWIFIRRDQEAITATLLRPPAEDVIPPFELHFNTLSDAYPWQSDTTEVMVYSGFHLAYNEEFEQAAWVAYVLTKNDVLSGTEARTENFRPDTMIKTGSAAPVDYLRSGYDRGHLAPAADFKWSSTAMSESFLMSNMSPQLPGFNRGVWSRLESKVRDWAIANDSILVITGPIFNGIEVYIGENRVGVPRAYFKVIADISSPSYKVLAFIMDNQSSQADLFSFAVAIDSVESITGFDFFAGQPDRKMIERAESVVDLTAWR